MILSPDYAWRRSHFEARSHFANRNNWEKPAFTAALPFRENESAKTGQNSHFFRFVNSSLKPLLLKQLSRRDCQSFYRLSVLAEPNQQY